MTSIQFTTAQYLIENLATLAFAMTGVLEAARCRRARTLCGQWYSDCVEHADACTGCRDHGGDDRGLWRGLT